MSEESLKSIRQVKKLVDEDPENVNKRFIRAKEGVEIYGISKTKFLELARAAGALYKLEGTCLINVEIFEQYLESYRIPGAVR